MQGVDLLFPIHCAGCGQEGAWLCPACAGAIEFRPLITRREGLLERVVALIPYRDPATNRLISAYKYRNGFSALPVIQMLVRRGVTPSLLPSVDLVVPVPLHRMRLHTRGYNQADGIAVAVATALSVPCRTDLLIRARGGAQQAKKDPLDRRQAFLPGTFLVPDPRAVLGRRVLVVDDVYTTGATFEAIAEALRSVGAASVSGFALAYGG